MTVEVWESRRIDIGNKLGEASNRLDAEATHYKMIKAKLDAVELRCEELVKELQSLEDQKKDFRS